MKLLAGIAVIIVCMMFPPLWFVVGAVLILKLLGSIFD